MGLAQRLLPNYREVIDVKRAMIHSQDNENRLVYGKDKEHKKPNSQD